MKTNYIDTMAEFVKDCEPNKSDKDIDTLYRFAYGNRHPLSEIAENVTLDEFIQLYREAEQMLNQ